MNAHSWAFTFLLKGEIMAKIGKLTIIRGAAELVASAGTGVVIGNLVKATTPYDLNRVQRVLVAVGGYTLGGVLSDLSAKYISNQIQSYADKLSSVLHREDEDVIVVEESPTIDGIPAEDFEKPARTRSNFETPESEEGDESENADN
jgi:hypothetical protein